MQNKISEDVESRTLTIKLLIELFGAAGIPQVTVGLWDGTLWPDATPRPVTLKLNHPGALRAMLAPGTEVGMVEAYLFDDVDILGDSEQIYAFGETIFEKTGSLRNKIGLVRELLRLPNLQYPRETKRGPAHLAGKKHSIARDRQAIAYHYDVSNDFFALFLGQRMVYSCGYFRTPQDSLDTAQEQKLEHICRKLRLKPGMRILDVGCGWGGLVMYAAQKYGVQATGITLSQSQAEFANRRIGEAGLSAQAQVLLKDYREVVDYGSYDALVSVGMFEHVGAGLLPTYFEQAFKLVRPGGVFLNHGIARRAGEADWYPYSFSDAYVFPDGELVPISQTVRVAEEAGFEVRDVESLREHYALTLRRWVHNLEACHDQALSYVDEPTYRVWRVSNSYPAHGYASGRFNLYHTLLVKPTSDGSSGFPLTREDWYRK